MSTADKMPEMSRRNLLRMAGATGFVALTAGALTLGSASAAQASQGNWRWCYKCEGMWFNGHPTNGVCPPGGAHSSSGSGNYAIKFSGDGGAGQDGWRWCYRAGHAPVDGCHAERCYRWCRRG